MSKAYYRTGWPHFCKKYLLTYTVNINVKCYIQNSYNVIV